MNDLVSNNKLRARDSNEHEDSMFDPCTIHEVMIPDDTTFIQSEYGASIFQTGVHLSRIDSKTGYDDYDPRDIEPDEHLEESKKQYSVIPHGSKASHIPSVFTNLLSTACFTRQRMLLQGASEVHIYDNKTGEFWDHEGKSELIVPKGYSEDKIIEALSQICFCDNSIYASHDIGSIPCAPLLTDTTLYPDPKLDPLTILQNARYEIIHEKSFNNLAFWFLCDAILYLITGDLK
jgi:hypothetical protein